MRTRKALAAVLAVGVAVTVGACGGSSPADRSTPADSPTVVNSAPQTVDEQGNPVQTTPPSTGGGQTGGGQTGGGQTGGGTTTGGGGAPTGDAAAGKTVFMSNGCGSCHTLSEAATAGTVGPNLDDVLKGKPPDFIRESIIDPNKEIASGFTPNIMPSTYGQQLTPTQIDDLVALLAKP